LASASIGNASEAVVRLHLHSRPGLKQVKAKIRALTHRTSQANMGTRLTRINQVPRGCVNYFCHAVCSRTLDHLRHFVKLASDPLAEETPPRHWGNSADTSPPLRAVAADIGGRDHPVQPPIGPGHPIPPTGATRSPAPGSASTTPNGSSRGEPVASKGAPRARRAAREHGPAATPAPPRADSTSSGSVDAAGVMITSRCAAGRTLSSPQYTRNPACLHTVSMSRRSDRANPSVSLLR
jgi:hypothetical protein